MRRLAIGAAQFGLAYGIANKNGQVPQQEIDSILKLAASNNVDMLDTAIAYGNSEACLGRSNVSAFKTVTKLPAVPVGCSDVSGWVRDQVAASLTRLQLTSLYGLLLHRPNQLLEADGEDIYLALDDLRGAGLVQKIGISIYHPAELLSLTERYDFDLVQAPFNVVDRRLYTSGWLQKLKNRGIEVHTRSVFLQGLLLMPAANIPPQFSSWHHLWSDWHSWLSKYNICPVSACLEFAFSFPEIDRVIVGIDSKKQLLQILEKSRETITMEFPDLASQDEQLINPAKWSSP